MKRETDSGHIQTTLCVTYEQIRRLLLIPTCGDDHPYALIWVSALSHVVALKFSMERL